MRAVGYICMLLYHTDYALPSQSVLHLKRRDNPLGKRRKTAEQVKVELNFAYRLCTSRPLKQFVVNQKWSLCEKMTHITYIGNHAKVRTVSILPVQGMQISTFNFSNFLFSSLFKNIKNQN